MLQSKLKGRNLREYFSQLDKDGGGFLSEDEFKTGVQNLARLNDREVQLVWEYMDVDGDKEVCLSEFINMFTRKFCVGRRLL